MAIIFLPFCTGSPARAELKPEPEPVTITVSGAEGESPIMIALFADAAAFAQQDHATASASIIPDQAGTAQASFTLPPGRYAIAMYQDRDENGRLSTNFLGMPTEPYGFSGPPMRLGVPDFEAAAIELPGPAPVLVSLRKLW